MAPLRTLTGLMAASTLLAACSATPQPNTHESEMAPRIILNKEGAKEWNDPAAFGPVPDEKLEDGIEYCATLDTPQRQFKPAGYHSRAETIDGYLFQDGGFLCIPK